MNISTQTKSPLKSILALCLVLAAVGLLAYHFINTSSVTVKSSPQGGNFQLESTNGPTTLDAFQGKVVLLFFGFTRCPDVCPTTLSDLTRLVQLLPAEQSQNLQILFISLDSTRDTIETAQTYVNNFNSHFLALTGSEKELEKITNSYGAFFRKTKLDSKMGYTIDHSTQIFVIAPNGRWVDSIKFGSSAEVMRDQLKPLLESVSAKY